MAIRRIGWMFVFTLLFLVGCSAKAEEQERFERADFSERIHVSKSPEIEWSAIDMFIDEMTVEEKVGQLIIAGFSGKTFDGEMDKLIRNHHIGGLILLGKNVSSPSGIIELLNESKRANVGNKVPLLLSVDEEGGRVSRLPSGLKQLPAAASVGKVNDEGYAYGTGVYLAEVLHTFGYNMNYAPVLDVNSNPRNPVIGDRSYSSNPHITASLGLSVMRGMKDNSIISVVKHFPGHGDTYVDSHHSLPVIRKKLNELRLTELVPFQQAIDENVDAIMVAHVLFPELDEEYPSSLSEKIVTGLLRGEMGYDGVVITDDLTMGAIVNDYSVPEAALQAFQAGNDLLLIAGDYENQVEAIAKLIAAVESGDISEERLDESVRRILELKERFNLEDGQVESFNANRLDEKYDELVR